MFRVLKMWFSIIFLAAVWIGGIIWHIVKTVYWLRCRKKHYDTYTNPCHERNCRYNQYCSKYHETITEEERDELLKMLDNY